MKLSLYPLCDAVTKWSLYIALFLTPIFFLPLTLYPVDLNKQFVFSALVFVGAIAWLIKSAARGTMEYPKGFAGIPLAALVAFTVVSAFFSPARHIGFMGVTGGEADTAIALISFALLYFLIAVSFREKEDFRNGFVALMASGSIAVFLFLLQVSGLSFLPWDFAQGGGFNAVGTMNAFALYVGIIAVLSFALLCRASVAKRMRVWGGILAGVSFVLAFLVGYWAAFVCLIIASGIFVFLDARSEEKKSPRRNFVPFGVIVVSVCMLVLATGVVSIPVPRIAASPEVTPSVSASLSIALMTAREGVRSFFLGSGPSTYQYQYAKYHDSALNTTIFWNVRFTQGFDAILTSLVSLGLFGTLLLLLFIGGVVHMMVRLVRSRRADHKAIALVSAGAYAIIALFLYPQNFVLYFLLFALAGMVAASSAEGKGGYGAVSFAVSIGGMFAIAAFAGLLYVNGSRYFAAIQFARGISAATEAKDVDRGLPLLMAGVALDPENDGYLQALASAYVARANALASTAGSAPSAEVQKKVAGAIAAAIAVAERATQVNLANAQNWLALAEVYGAVAPFNASAASSIISVYGKAASLDPTNPAIPAYLGNAHVTAKEYGLARSAFEKAISLKADYAPAYVSLIQMLDAQGKGADALLWAERLRTIAPDNAPVLFQIGVLHYQAGRMDNAQDVLEQAVRVSSDYANALYFLGLVYEKQGDHARALLQFERVLKLNPGNVELKKIMDDIRAKK